MKNIMTIIAIITVYTVKAQGINFEHNLTWKQIQAKAKLENKYIFVDAYATWCGPCKAMSSDIFPKKEVGDFINNKFIAVKVQMDQTKEDDDYAKAWYGDAKFFAQEYKITAYPTILFFSTEGKLVHKSIGFRDDKALLKDAEDALNPEEQYYTLLSLYENGKSDAASLKNLAIKTDKIGEDEMAHKIGQQYLKCLPESALFKKDNYSFVVKFTTSSKDKSFSFFKKNAVKINELFGENEAEKKISSIVVKEEIEPYLKNKSLINWIEIEKRVRDRYGKIGLESFYGERMVYALDHKNWDTFGKYYALYYTTAYNHSKFHINNISWALFENVSNPKVLRVAIKTMKYSLEHFDQNNLQAYDTYANLLYKMGKKDEAILWENKALQIDAENALKGNRKPDPVFAETLEKMKAGVKTWIDQGTKQ